MDSIYHKIRQSPTQVMGYMAGDTWHRDPKRLTFTLARYKFVSKMLEGHVVLEVGAGDCWASKMVAQQAKAMTCIDVAPMPTPVPHFSMTYKQHDIMKGPLEGFTAAFALDVFEHIADEQTLLKNLRKCAPMVILGTPSLESQIHASHLSKEGHVNCKSGEDLRNLMREHFRHVLMFGMNDEVVHTGFFPMCHYLFSIGIK